MDYEFSRDEDGKILAQFSIGHEAIGLWFSEELACDKIMITSLLDKIHQLEVRKITSFSLDGKEFQLRLQLDQIEVVALVLGFDIDQELPENTNLYDQESYSECGLQDFKQVLLDWYEFISAK